MKILVIGFVEYPGTTAASHHIQRLSFGLGKIGHDVIVIGFGGLSFKSGDDAFGIRFFNFPNDRNSLFPYLSAIRRFRKQLSNYLRKFLLNEKPDLVIYHGRSFWVGEQIRKACNESRIELIPFQVEWYPASIQRLLNGSFIDQTLFRRFTLRRCRRMIGISYFWKSWSDTRGIACEVIPALNPPNPQVRVKSRLTTKPLRLIFIGGLTKRELPKSLFRGLSIAILQGADVTLTVVGKPPSDIERLAAARDTSPALTRTRFTGWLSPDSLLTELSNSAAAILLRTDTRETRALFPTRVPEYMIAGVPLIASSAGDLPHYLVDGVNSLLIPSGDRPVELGQAIQSLSENPELCLELSQNAIKTASQYFDPILNATRLTSFLESGIRSD